MSGRLGGPSQGVQASSFSQTVEMHLIRGIQSPFLSSSSHLNISLNYKPKVQALFRLDRNRA